jgi:hypothetical protein
MTISVMQHALLDHQSLRVSPRVVAVSRFADNPIRHGRQAQVDIGLDRYVL